MINCFIYLCKKEQEFCTKIFTYFDHCDGYVVIINDDSFTEMKVCSTLSKNEVSQVNIIFVPAEIENCKFSRSNET